MTTTLDTIDQALAEVEEQRPVLAKLTDPLPVPVPAVEPDPEPGTEAEPTAEPPAADTEPDTTADDEDQEDTPASSSSPKALAVLLVVSALGALIVAAIGFAGSYDAVRTLAEQKGFPPRIAAWVPIGVDAGICAFLALDLALTWKNMPVPFLRPMAHGLTGATIWFNAASHWGDPTAVGMHAVLPILFVAAVEAARKAAHRIAGLEAGTHIDGIRAARWLLAPWPTFRLWRRMRMWEITSYREAIALERQRTAYRMMLKHRYGSVRKAPQPLRLRLRMTRYGSAVDAPLPDVEDLLTEPEPTATGGGSTGSGTGGAGTGGAGGNRSGGKSGSTGTGNQGGTGGGSTGSGNRRGRRRRANGDAPGAETREAVRARVRELIAAGETPSPTALAAEFNVGGPSPAEWVRNQIRAVRAEMDR